MKVSYNWLQTYFEENLPKVEVLTEILTFHAFEIEGVERVGSDIVIDVDVLPNRSSDCLSHRGIAHELSVLLEVPMKIDPLYKKSEQFPESKVLSVDVKDSKLCRRYSAAVMRGVKVGPSPAWLTEYLEAIGQKSINNIVDATNYIMFGLGQPLHAFDMGNLLKDSGGGSYSISVRTAKKGERIKTLDDINYALDEETLLIVDGNSDKVIGIAGIKGGDLARVDGLTKDIVIESANFDPLNTRKSSRRLKLRTDASVRFENDIPKEFTEIALNEVVELIKKIAGGELEGFVDFYPKKNNARQISISAHGVNSLLGIDISKNEVSKILDRFNFEYTEEEGKFSVTVPFERLDLSITEDLIEEIGRIYGYRNISSKELSVFNKEIEIDKKYYYAEKIRSIMSDLGFSEVYTYSLRNKGDVALLNPLASDKAYLREDLSSGIHESLLLNTHNAPLLGLDEIKIFEIGIVFRGNKELLNLAFGISLTQKVKNEKSVVEKSIQEVFSELSNRLKFEVTGKIENSISEIDLSSLIDLLPQPKSYDPHKEVSEVLYKPISQYPFALRDVSVWTPSGTTSEDVIDVINKEVGEILVRHSLFDAFEKDGRVSYALHLVFQSNEKTLSEKELTIIMDKVYRALGEKDGWEVR